MKEATEIRDELIKTFIDSQYQRLKNLFSIPTPLM